MKKIDAKNMQKSPKITKIDEPKRKSDSLKDLVEKRKVEAEQRRKEALVAEIWDDFEERKRERKNIESGFALCMNFALGNQQTYLSPYGEVKQIQKEYSWENNDCYNHIAPIIETRLAKLGKVRPLVHVRPASEDDEDVLSAKMSTALLSSEAMRQKLDEVICEATLWSEVCGTAFYKIGWNSAAGCAIGEDDDGNLIAEGEIEISVCNPFEIFPSSGTAKNMDAVSSIIHAKALPVEQIFDNYDVRVDAQDIDVFGLTRTADSTVSAGLGSMARLAKNKLKNAAIVIERYTMPNVVHPNGRLEIVAGDQLVFEGDLPFVSPCGKRYLPFVRQISLANVGSFWGGSVVERCIPLQRAYNSIKNRKHQLLSRLAAGVLIVEDGSVDIDALEDEGLAPGKMLVYRNGSTAPRFMDEGSVPSEFTLEENRILDEFVSLSGVSEFSSKSVAPTNITSGVALGLLAEQDDTRLAQTADYIRFAVREIGRQILSVFKQFGTSKQLLEIAGKNGEVEKRMFEMSHITSDDVCLDTENEMAESPSSRKAMVMDLLRAGLFADENGKIGARTKSKILEALGFGNWENVSDITEVQQARALRENYGEEKPKVLEVDDHNIHIAEHTKWVIENSESAGSKVMMEHIKEHKLFLKMSKQSEDIAK